MSEKSLGKSPARPEEAREAREARNIRKPRQNGGKLNDHGPEKVVTLPSLKVDLNPKSVFGISQAKVFVQKLLMTSI